MRRAVFLDRDGTIIEEKKYLHRWQEVEIFPGAGSALKKLGDAGFVLVIVTNQAGVGRGYYKMESVHEVNAHLSRELGKEGVRFDKIYIAPEAPGEPSYGRKPSPGFLFDARVEFGLDLSSSYFIGDKLIDLECGWNAGVRRSLLVRTGYGAEFERENRAALRDAVIVNGLPEAADWILSDSLKANKLNEPTSRHQC